MGDHNSKTATTLYLTEEVRARLRVYAAMQDKTMSIVVEDLVVQHIPQVPALLEAPKGKQR